MSILMFLNSIVSVPGQQRGKGTLLLWESEEDIERRTKPYIRLSMIAIPTGVAIIVSSLISFIFISIFWGYLITPFMIGLLILMLGLTFLAWGRMTQPMRIYENGIDIPVGKRIIFVSYGEFRQIREQMNPFEKEMYVVLEGSTPYQRAGLRKSMRGLDSVLDSVRSKIGKPEYIIDVEPTQEEETASRRFEYSMYATGPIAVIMFVVILTFPFDIYPGTYSYYFFLDQMLWIPIIGIAFTTMIPLFFLKSLKKLVPRRLNLKVPIGIVIGFLIFLFVVATVGDDVITSAFHPEENIGSKPSSTSLAPGIYDGENLTVDGNITVGSGEMLSIRNSVVIMELGSDKQFGIWIEEGGTFILENTRLRSDRASFGYTFEIMGSATITGSHISGIWGDPKNENFDGGLEIYSSDVLVENTRIEDAITNGILIMNSNPTIINTTITNAGDDGIEMKNSDAQILNNTIERCSWAMIVEWSSDAVIQGNVFSHNKYGIAIGSSDPVIEDNLFERNSNYAISCDQYSNPSIKDNVFTMNDEDISKSNQYFFGGSEVCLVIAVIVAILCLFFLFRAHRETSEEMPKL